MALAACAGGGASGTASTKTVAEGEAAAVFGDHVITESEVSDYTNQFRQSRNLEGDREWADYLITNSLTSKTWRERVIREKADRILIEEKAAELGIKVDEQAVDERIAQERDAAGIAAEDDQAWASYLSESGQTPEGLRDSYEYSSLQQQVYSSEIEFTSHVADEMCDDYIHANLADQVVRRYSALTFGKEDADGARACLERLSGLSGDDVRTAFAAELDERTANGGLSSLDGDMGWDFLYDEYAIDPELELRKAKLAAGELYGNVLAGEDALRVVLCDERVSLENASYGSLESESLRGLIRELALAANWTALCLDYTERLEEDAHVKVAQMPEGLDYDVVDAQG